jgi:hypothetical protein
VLRQCALSLRDADTPAAAEAWAQLATLHDGDDRWYLEALGIGAARHEDACYQAWRTKVGTAWNTKGGRDLVWRSRSDLALEDLVAILKDESTPPSEQPRYMRAFDFHRGPAKVAALKKLVE